MIPVDLTVSVVIPSYNRFDAMADAVESALLQTLPVHEVIVVDDASPDPRYATFSRPKTRVVRRPVNTGQEFGYAAPGTVRNIGMEAATGEYVAFCDDDDVWLPRKLELQLNLMAASACRMSSTEGYMCRPRWRSADLPLELQTDFQGRFPKYNREHHWEVLRKRCHLDSDFPERWNRDFLRRHNAVITSSVLFHRSLLEQAGWFRNLPIGQEDYEFWLRLLEHTDSAYVSSPCFGYCRGPRRR